MIMIVKVRKFIGEVITETKKVSWTNRQELINATCVVFFSSILLGLFIAGIDFALSKFLGLLIR